MIGSTAATATISGGADGVGLHRLVEGRRAEVEGVGIRQARSTFNFMFNVHTVSVLRQITCSYSNTSTRITWEPKTATNVRIVTNWESLPHIGEIECASRQVPTIENAYYLRQFHVIGRVQREPSHSSHPPGAA